MEEKQFRIGEMVQMTGLSRDTLRFYEKKGVICAKRRENGYRYYSEGDLYKLMTICFHRKMNDALASIEEILSHSSLEAQMEHIERREMERKTVSAWLRGAEVSQGLYSGKLYIYSGGPYRMV